MVSITQFTSISAPAAVRLRELGAWSWALSTSFVTENGKSYDGSILICPVTLYEDYKNKVVPVNLKRQSVSYPIGAFSKFSTQSLEYQDLDYHPRLSTGKVERPCHHEKLDGKAYVPSDYISYEEMSIGPITPFGAISTAKGIFLDYRGSLQMIEGVQEYHYGENYSHHMVITWSATTLRLTYKRWYEEPDKPTTFEVLESVQMTAEAVQFGRGHGMIYGLDYVSGKQCTFNAGICSGMYPSSWSFSDDPVDLRQVRDLIQDYFQVVANRYSRVGSTFTDRHWAFWSDGIDLRGGVDVNMIENMSDIDLDSIRRLPHLLKMMKSRGEIKRIPKTLKGVVQLLAGSYLSTKYGLCNMIRDIDSFISYISENGLSILRQPKTVLRNSKQIQTADFSGSMFTKTCLVPKPDVPDHELVNLFGLELSPTQLWEVVPYSFAIDWIIQIGDFISRSDARALAIYRYDLIYQLRSYKLSTAIQHREKDFAFTGSYTVYDRCIATTFPAADLSVSTDNKLFGHILEAGCLLVNSIK